MQTTTNNRNLFKKELDSTEPKGSDPRLDRINCYRDVALQKSDLLDANLGLVTSGLLKMAYRQEQLYDQAYEHRAHSPRGREQLRLALDDHLRVTRQLERLMQLEIRSAELRKRR
jgi:hypothetical protein